MYNVQARFRLGSGQVQPFLVNFQLMDAPPVICNSFFGSQIIIHFSQFLQPVISCNSHVICYQQELKVQGAKIYSPIKSNKRQIAGGRCSCCRCPPPNSSCCYETCLLNCNNQFSYKHKIMVNYAAPSHSSATPFYCCRSSQAGTAYYLINKLMSAATRLHSRMAEYYGRVQVSSKFP